MYVILVQMPRFIFPSHFRNSSQGIDFHLNF